MLRRLLVVVLVVGAVACGCADTATAPRASWQIELGPGEVRLAGINGHCGYEWLASTINDQTWHAADDWPGGGTVVEFELELVDAQTLLARRPGDAATYEYHPEDGRPLCE